LNSGDELPEISIKTNGFALTNYKRGNFPKMEKM
jgi:hypothetical protein